MYHEWVWVDVGVWVFGCVVCERFGHTTAMYNYSTRDLMYRECAFVLFSIAFNGLRKILSYNLVVKHFVGEDFLN